MNEQTISKTLKEFGIPVHLLGYEYLKEALELVMSGKTFKCKMTKELYPRIAADHNTTASRVERAMRHAIEHSWSCTFSDFQVLVFGNTVSINKGKPTNGQFIVTVADYIKSLERKDA